MDESEWERLPTDILQQITPLLDMKSLQAARLVCKSWCQGLSMGVAFLRPRFESSALDLQWWPHKMQEAFPALREMDLRQLPPMSHHAPFFSPLTSLRRIYVSSLQRPADPKILLAELRELGTALQISNPATQLDLELRFGKSSLLWGKPTASQADSDADICAVSDLPGNVEVTMLHMPQLCYAISAKGLASIMGLTRLRHLRLVTYSAHLTDVEFHALAGLVHLEHLSFGVVPFVTDAGLLEGLGKLKLLRELFLYNVGSVTDAGIAALAACLSALEGLSLSKCHRLTDQSLDSLSRLWTLKRLILSENEHITSAAADRFIGGEKSLTVRQCPNVNRSDIHI